jgi:hypothetical protein
VVFGPGMRLAGLAAALLTVAGAARAEADLFSRDTISGMVDLRGGWADGEESWLEHGYGKLQGGGERGQAGIDLAAVVWRPTLGWDWSAYVDLVHQDEGDQPVDLDEAYLSYRPTPRSQTRLSARVGLFYPPVSLEHDGPAWSVSRTLTPSAANSWIAEEVKVGGVEGTVSAMLGDHRLSATAALFGFNDTSGTLLSFRGWALHDVRTTVLGKLPLPRTDAFHHALYGGQADIAQPTLELDGDIGGYAKLEWRPPAPVALSLFYYDNAGDPQVFEHNQWGWRTRFANLSLVAKPRPDIEILAQALHGNTYYGAETPMGRYVDVDFSAAYVLATWTGHRHRVTGRVDYFETRDRSFQAIDDNNEHGWALTAAYAYSISPHAAVWVEALHVSSDRAQRAYVGPDQQQAQTGLQTALRYSF